jgi:competence protein ComEC
MKYSNLPVLQICTVFLLGSWIGFFEIGLDFSFYITLTLVVFLFFLISFFLARRFLATKLLFTAVSLLFLISIGFLNTKIHLSKHQGSHYSGLTTIDSTLQNSIMFQGRVIKALKSNGFKDKFEFQIQSINSKPYEGKVLLQISKRLNSNLSANSRISGFGQIQLFKNPQNPQQFNYKDYMATQQMSHFISTDYDSLLIEKEVGFSFLAFGEKVRSTIQNSLQKHDFSKAQLDIIQALLLGQKQDIDPETYNQFSKAGVVHILAVSGLHVGIILIILQFVTKGLLNFRYGRVLRNSLVLIGIWGFATLAGYTPSVLRAAVMFSFLSIALNYRRKTSAVNTLALSAVFLITINPYLLFQVGFQLSYLAVISIVILQPRLSKLYSPRYYLDRKVWDISCVTITAQLGVLPLSLYYFHQFPGLFLVSNLVILPGLGMLLGGGIIIIALSLLNLLPETLVSLYASLLDALLWVVEWIASQESLIINDVYFTKTILISSLVLFFSLILWDSKQKLRSYFILNLSLVALLLFIYIENRDRIQQKEILIFQTYRESQLGVLEGSHLTLFSDQPQDIESLKLTYHLKNYKTLKGITHIDFSKLKSNYEINPSEILFVLDSIPAYPEEGFNPTYVLLKDSPDLNFDRLLQDLKPKQVIADGSNYKTDIERWRNSAQLLGIPFHSTWEDGAYIFPKN